MPQSLRPAVSVVIPTRERHDFLLEALESVHNQTFTGHVEIIVVDDASVEPVEPMIHERFPDVKVVRKPVAEGCGRARQTGTEVAGGRLIAYLDDDDLFLPQKLELQVAFMQAHPDVDLCLHDFIKFSPEGDFPLSHFTSHTELWAQPHRKQTDDPPSFIWDARSFTPALFNGAPFPPQTLMIRRAHWDGIGGWCPFIPGIGEDVEFGIRASFYGKVGFINTPLSRVRRLHGSNISGDVTRTYAIAAREVARVSREYPDDLRDYVDHHIGTYFARVGWMLYQERRYAAAADYYRQAISFGDFSLGIALKLSISMYKTMLGLGGPGLE